jgi:hypothetical protein
LDNPKLPEHPTVRIQYWLTLPTFLLILLVATEIAHAQADPGLIAANRQLEIVTRLEQELQDQTMAHRRKMAQGQTINERLTLDVGGSFRFGLASLDEPSGSSRTLRQYETNLYVLSKFDGGHTFFGNLRFLYNDWNTGDSRDSDGLFFPYGNRYWYELDTRALSMYQTGVADDVNLNIRVGRQFINWNSGLAFSNDMYAFLGSISYEQFKFTGLFGQTARSGLYDFDVSRPEYDQNTDRVYWGLKLEANLMPEFQPFVSYLVQRDHNDDETVRTFFGDIDFNYDSEYLSFGAAGTIGPQLTYAIEAVHETGHTLSTFGFNFANFTPEPQTRNPIDAWAGSLTAAWAFRNDTNALVDMTLAMGTGDGNRIVSNGTIGGDALHSTDRAFNSLGYINTGLALAPQIANLRMLRIGGSTAINIDPQRPNTLRGGVDVFFLQKNNKEYVSSVPTTNKRNLGWEMDWKLDWQLMSDVTFNFRYGVFFPGDGLPEGIDDIRHFVYGAVSYAF